MEVHKAQAFLAVAEELHFGRAAKRLHMAQPPLSRLIRQLETELGAPLFHREGKKVLLSEFGRSMLPHLQRIADEVKALCARFPVYA